MNNGLKPARRPGANLKIALALFLTLACVYVLTGSAHFYLLDARFKLVWAENVIRRGQLHFDEDQIGKKSRIGTYFYPGRNGDLYIHFPLGGLFCFLPPALAGAGVARVVPSVTAFDAGYALASFNNAPWAAAAAALVFLLGRYLRQSPRRAAGAGLAFGLATPMFPYATHDFNEPVAAFFTLAATALVIVGWEKRKLRFPLAAGLTLAFAFIIRYELLAFFAGALALWLALALARRAWLRDAAAFAAAFVALAAVVPLYNWFIRGGPTDFAYNTLPFFTNLIAARFDPISAGGPAAFAARFVWIYFLSPNMHNVILYCPLALFGVLSARALARAHGPRALFLVVPALVLAGAVIFTTYSSWAWGLRYAFVFWAVLAAAAVLAPRRGKPARVLFAICVAWGVALGVIAVAADYQLTQNDVAVAIIGDPSQVNYRGWIPEGRTNPRYSQILWQAKYAAEAAVRTVDYYVHRGELRWLDRPPPGLRGDTRAMLDVWPVYSQVHGEAGPWALWPPYLLVAIGGVAAARWLTRMLRGNA